MGSWHRHPDDTTQREARSAITIFFTNRSPSDRRCSPFSTRSAHAYHLKHRSRNSVIRAPQCLARFVSTFLDIFEAMWKNGKDVSVPDVLAESLQARFDKDQIKAILSAANSAPIKQRLNDNTKEALERGAFGCPWFWVRNAEGAEEPFFGSDRYGTLQSRPLLRANGSASGIAWAPADGKVVESTRFA